LPCGQASRKSPSPSLEKVRVLAIIKTVDY
jgi:hypothetical protein